MKILAKTYVDVLHEAHNDRSQLLARTKELLANTDPKIVEAVVDSWLGRDVFVPVWGMEPQAVDGAIKFYSSARPYRRIKAFLTFRRMHSSKVSRIADGEGVPWSAHRWFRSPD